MIAKQLARKKRYMYCKHCGKKIAQDSKFCTSCGGQVAIKSETNSQILELVEESENVLKSSLTQEKNNTETKPEFIIASQSKRLTNYIIDLIIGSYVAPYLIGFVLGSIGVLTGNEDETLMWLIALIIFALYYFFLELFFGQTIGKLITGTRVVMRNGDKANEGALFIRTLIRFVPFEAFSFSGKRPVGWHDDWSKTIVIEN